MEHENAQRVYALLQQPPWAMFVRAHDCWVSTSQPLPNYRDGRLSVISATTVVMHGSSNSKNTRGPDGDFTSGRSGPLGRMRDRGWVHSADLTFPVVVEK